MPPVVGVRAERRELVGRLAEGRSPAREHDLVVGQVRAVRPVHQRRFGIGVRHGGARPASRSVGRVARVNVDAAGPRVRRELGLIDPHLEENALERVDVARRDRRERDVRRVDAARRARGYAVGLVRGQVERADRRRSARRGRVDEELFSPAPELNDDRNLRLRACRRRGDVRQRERSVKVRVRRDERAARDVRPARRALAGAVALPDRRERRVGDVHEDVRHRIGLIARRVFEPRRDRRLDGSGDRRAGAAVACRLGRTKPRARVAAHPGGTAAAARVRGHADAALKHVAASVARLTARDVLRRAGRRWAEPHGPAVGRDVDVAAADVGLSAAAAVARCEARAAIEEIAASVARGAALIAEHGARRRRAQRRDAPVGGQPIETAADVGLSAAAARLRIRALPGALDDVPASIPGLTAVRAGGAPLGRASRRVRAVGEDRRVSAAHVRGRCGRWTAADRRGGAGGRGRRDAAVGALREGHGASVRRLPAQDDAAASVGRPTAHKAAIFAGRGGARCGHPPVPDGAPVLRRARGRSASAVPAAPAKLGRGASAAVEDAAAPVTVLAARESLLHAGPGSAPAAQTAVAEGRVASEERSVGQPGVGKSAAGGRPARNGGEPVDARGPTHREPSAYVVRSHRVSLPCSKPELPPAGRDDRTIKAARQPCSTMPGLLTRGNGCAALSPRRGKISNHRSINCLGRLSRHRPFFQLSSGLGR